MKHCLRSDVYTDVPRQRLKTVGNKIRNMKKLQKVDANAIFLGMSVSLTICIDRLLVF